ncbi:hypothetical protein NW766_011864 [Fusarium irregulare]|uniref:CHAT domain-containing protein n=1 Tax=Fusarium irregulare TaxID=2494466 RepID=A0A9W8PF18_9HYPO|nr:hypothetical protein NW766_011864 [Fusarium irregulare]
MDMYQVHSQANHGTVIWRMTKYLKTKDLADLELAVKESEATLLSTPEGHVYRAGRRESLGNLYLKRHSRSGNISDLDLALGVLQDAQGIQVPTRKITVFKRIDVAIQNWKVAINVTKLDHPDRIQRLYDLGCKYTARYRRTETIADLNEGVDLFQQCLQAASDDDPQRTSLIACLGTCCEDRHGRTKSMADIDKSLQLRETALHLTPSHDSQYFVALINLGAGHGIRFQSSKNPKDIESALQRFREALDVMPDEPLSRKISLQGLTKAHEQMYQQNGTLGDLETAIKYQEESIASGPDNHPDEVFCLTELGNLYQDGYRVTREQADIDTAVEKYGFGLKSGISPPKDRFKSGRDLFYIYADAQKWTSAYDIAGSSMDLVPLLTPRFPENSDKQHLVTEMADFAADAAAVALRAGQSPSVAVHLLEQGRGIISSSLNEMRRDLSDLENRYPDHASRFSKLREDLDRPGTSTEVDQRYGLAEMLETLIKEIRSLPGFERFLLPLTEEEIKTAAWDGPIVVLNASQYGCAAVVVKYDAVKVLQLSILHHADLHTRSMTFTSPDKIHSQVLTWLWDSIGCPVLDFLGITEPSAEHWPRMWWIPMPILSKFPIHGAGYHDSGLGSTMLDRVISSYSSSIRALIHGRRGHTPPRDTSRSKNVVLVGVENTPGHRSLPFTSEEVQQLADTCAAPYLNIKRPQPYQEEVIDTLRECDIFHFAGHGFCDSKNPSRSALLLGDGP